MVNLKEKSKFIGLLMNSVNHDLRTPLNYLMNSNYLINEDGQSYLNE